MNQKNFEKINIKTIISIQKSTSLQNFSQFEEIQIMGPDCPKSMMSDEIFGKINFEIVISL